MDAAIVLCVGVLIYLLPTIIASFRHKTNQGGIFIINLLLGWSVIGWIIALVMACSANPYTATNEQERAAPPRWWTDGY